MFGFGKSKEECQTELFNMTNAVEAQLGKLISIEDYVNAKDADEMVAIGNECSERQQKVNLAKATLLIDEAYKAFYFAEKYSSKVHPAQVTRAKGAVEVAMLMCLVYTTVVLKTGTTDATRSYLNLTTDQITGSMSIIARGGNYKVMQDLTGMHALTKTMALEDLGCALAIDIKTSNVQNAARIAM